MLTVIRHAAPTTHHAAQRRRAFFDFAKLSPASLFARDDPGTQHYHERRILPYQRSELYNVIADVASYSSFVPYCTGSRILQSKMQEDGITVMEAELTVDFFAFKESYVSTVTCKPGEFVQAVASSSLFKSLTTAWRLQPVSSSLLLSTPHIATKSVASRAQLGQGPTLVTLDLAFAFANPLHAAVSATFVDQLSKHMSKAFEQRCVTLYGSRTD